VKHARKNVREHWLIKQACVRKIQSIWYFYLINRYSGCSHFIMEPQYFGYAIFLVVYLQSLKFNK
jgi:hypothetical protein